jgi:L,D-peptidoglycan transpeptidase YkuD (ErfK/YbiS/YcfS/YnhG family)
VTLVLTISPVALGAPTVQSGMVRSAAPKHTAGVPARSRQLLVGVADEWSSSSAVLQRFVRTGTARTSGRWMAVGDPFPARLGPNGLAWGIGLHSTPSGAVMKREGDDRSPAGVFTLSTAFGYSEAWAARTRLPYVTVGARDLFVEDPASPLYNAHVRIDHAPATAWERDQQMYQDDPAHRLEVLVDHNRTAPPTPGAGSAIFIHIWRGDGTKPTAGCTSVRDADLEALLSWLDPAATPVYALLPADEYRQFQKTWGLPARSL